MSELLDQINTDANKETISVKELTKALETGFFDKQENISTMIAELDTIDNTLERSCVQSLLKVAYQSPLYDKLQQYPEFINRLQIWSQHSYLESLDIDEKQIGQISLYILPKKPEDITLTTLSKYVDLKNILPEYHDMILSVLQNQVKLFTQLCPDGKSLLDMKWNSKNNGLDASVLEFSTISSLSDRIKKEAQVRKDYETIKNHNVKQIDPGKITKDCLKLWTITKLSTLPTELAKLDTQSAFAQFLQKNQNDVFYGPILQQYISIRLQPYLRKEGPVEYVSATIDKENPELKNYIVGTAYGKQLIQHTSEGYKNYKEQQQTLAKFHLTGATPDQIATFQRKRNNHQARVKPEYLKTIQEQEDKFNHESVLRHSQSTRDSMPYIKKGSVDKYIYNSVLTLTKDYVTLLLQTPEGKKLLKEKKYIDNPFMPGMRLNFAKGNIDSIVRDSFFEKFGDGIDDFKKAWKEGKREEVGRSIGSLVGGTVAAGATTILTGGSGVWAAGAAFTIGSRAGGSLGGMIGAGFEGKSWGEIGNAGLVGLGVGERDQNGKFVNYFTDTKGNVTQASLLHGAGRMGISLGTDYLSSVATFGLGNKIGLDKRAGKFVGAGWKQLASKGAVFGAEELFIENFLVDIPANTLQAGVSSYVLGNAIQDVGPRSAKLTKNSNPDKQLDPNIPSDTKGDIKAALGAMKQTFAQNISPENLGQTFAATIAYGGMLEGGRGAINRVSVALPALSVKNINEISTAYQSHLSDLQTKFPTLSIGKDMSMLTLDGKLLDQTHPRFAELQGSLTALQSLGASFTQEMEKISQIQQQLTDPASLEAKKRGLIYGRKLLHPHMTPMEVLDSRIKKLQSEIASTKKSDIKAQKEAVLKQMEEVKETLADKKTIISDVVMSESEVGGKIEGNKGQVEEVSVDDKKSEVYLQVGPIKVNKTILSEQHKELLYKIPGAKDIVLGSHILDLHRGETSDASVVKAGFKALQEKLLQAKNNGEELPSHILGLSNLSFVLGKYGFSIFDSLPVEVYTQVGQYKRLFGEADPKNPLTPAELKQKERIGQYNNGKNPIKAAIIDIETFLKLNFGKEGEGKDLQQHELSNVNNIESINKALEELVHLIPTEILRRPNGSIGTQGFTEENFMSVARYIAQEMGFTIPVYDKKSNVSEISQLINYLKNNKEAQQKIKEYVIKDPVIVSLLPDNTYHIEDGNHRANLLNLIGVDVIPTIERNGRDKQDVIDEHNAKVQTIENMYGQNPAVAKQSQDIGNSHIEGINNLTTHYPDLLKNIVNPEKISQIIQNEINAGNLVLNPDGTIKEVLVEINGEKKPSQLFAKMKADGFSEQQALKTWLQVRTPEFKNRFGDWQSTDKSQVSKVVDENGEPLVVYHGSYVESFNEFKPNLRYGEENGWGGSFFSAKIKKASMYGIPNLYFINMKNTKGVADIGLKPDKSLDGLYEKAYVGNDTSIATSEEMIVFDPKNIKSAINNDGSFSPETTKFNDYFGKESRFGFDSKQARDHSIFMDQFTIQATPEQITQIRQKIESVAKMYTDKTGKALELTDAQIQTIIATHLKPGELGKLTQAELKAKVAELATAIPDADVRRFLLEAGFCGMWRDKLKGFFEGGKKELTNELQLTQIRELNIGLIGDVIEQNIRNELSSWLVKQVGIKSYEELKTIIYNYDANNTQSFDPDIDNLLHIKKLAPQLDRDFFFNLRSQCPNMRLRDVVHFLKNGGKNTKDDILLGLRNYESRMKLLSKARDLLYDKYSDIKHLDPTRTTLAMRNFFYFGNPIDTYEECNLLIQDIKRELGLDAKLSWDQTLEQRSEHIDKLHKNVIESSDFNNIIYNKFFQHVNNKNILAKYENNPFLFELAKYGMGHIVDAPDISQVNIPDTSVINFINSGTLEGLDKDLAILLSDSFTSKNKNAEYCTNSIPTFMESIRDGSGIRFIDKEGNIFYTKFDAKIKTSLKINTKNNEVDFGGVSDLDFMIGKFVYKNKGLLSVEDINKELQKRGLEYQVFDNKGSLEIHSNHQIKFESVNGQTNTNIFREDGNPGSYWGAIYGNVTETELFKVYGDVILELNAMRDKDISVENLIQFYEKGKILATQLKHSEYIIAIDKILDDLHNKGTNRYMQIMDLIISNIEKPPGNILQEIQKIYNLP